MVEGTAVTESLHKWNTTPCTIASHKPELWCKCFSNMAWIYPCILRFNKKCIFHFLRTRNQRKLCTSCKQFRTMVAVFVNFKIQRFMFSVQWVSLALLEFELIISYVFSAVSPFHFGDEFTETGFRMPVSVKTVYWGADKGCWNAFVLHSFTCWELFCILLKS